MPTKKRTSTKSQAADPQTPERSEFADVDYAIAEAQAFLTSKIVRFIRAIGAAARRSDSDLLDAAVDLSCELRLADPEEWQSATGMELPRNVEELRALMADCGYSPDFIAAGEWTPREVGPVLLKKLRQSQMAADEIPTEFRSRQMSLCEAGMSYRRGVGLPKISRTKAGEYMGSVVRDFEDDKRLVCERGSRKHIFDIRIFAPSEWERIRLHSP